MALHGHTPKQRKKIKKDKKDKKKKPEKKLIEKSKFDPAHPASTILLARKQARDKKRNK